MPIDTAPVTEIFSSIAGEGTHLGRRQIFLRLAGCPFGCYYCDTPHSPAAAARLEEAPGTGRWTEQPNPLSVNDVLAAVRRLEESAPGHAHLAVTGGEPLLHVPFLTQLLPAARETGLGIYLETAGALPDELPPLLPLVDIIAADIKLPGHCGRPLWEESRRFLTLAADSPAELLIKVVFGRRSTMHEVLQALEIAGQAAPGRTVVLQPIHLPDGRPEPDPAQMLAMLFVASAYHPDVRLIPQTHKLLGLL